MGFMVEIGLKLIIIDYYFEIYRFIMILKFCKNYFKILGQKKKKMKMTWSLTWRNVSTTTLNTMLQLLVMYR